MNRFRVLANMAQSPQEGRNLFAKLTKVTDRFLDVALQYVGAVPYDESVRKAVQKQRAVYEAFPRSKCALAFKAIAQSTPGRCLPTRAGTWSFSSSASCNKRQDRCYDRQRLQPLQEVGT
jgi:flagellar biosynthesis protein FlhG